MPYILGDGELEHLKTEAMRGYHIGQSDKHPSEYSHGQMFFLGKAEMAAFILRAAREQDMFKAHKDLPWQVIVKHKNEPLMLAGGFPTKEDADDYANRLALRPCFRMDTQIEVKQAGVQGDLPL